MDKSTINDRMEYSKYMLYSRKNTRIFHQIFFFDSIEWEYSPKSSQVCSSLWAPHSTTDSAGFFQSALHNVWLVVLTPSGWWLIMDNNGWWCYSGWWWLEHGFDFPFHIWDVILPIDFHIFQRGWNHQPDVHISEILTNSHTISPFSEKNTRCEAHINGISHLPICRRWLKDIAAPARASLPSQRPVRRRWSPSSLRTITRGSGVCLLVCQKWIEMGGIVRVI